MSTVNSQSSKCPRRTLVPTVRFKTALETHSIHRAIGIAEQVAIVRTTLAVRRILALTSKERVEGRTTERAGVNIISCGRLASMRNVLISMGRQEMTGKRPTPHLPHNASP